MVVTRVVMEVSEGLATVWPHIEWIAGVQSTRLLKDSG